MSPQEVTKNVYQRLLAEITAVYDQAARDMKEAVDVILKDAYWEIGKRVVQVEQGGELRADYGKRLLESIARDMAGTDRKGFSVTNLRNMRRVYLAFPIQQDFAKTAELSWTHYVTLSSIKDEEERKVYLKKTFENHWTDKELKDVLLKNQVKTLSLEDDSPAAPGAPESRREPQILRYNFKRGILNTYRVLDPREKISRA